MPRIVLAALAVITATTAHADCASDAQIADFVAALDANEPAKALGDGGSMDDALCIQEKLATALAPSMGKVIGYKAGLTSPPAQQRFEVDEPVRGLLFEKMMLPDGATIPVRFGATPMVESDLVLVVGDAAINAAESPGEVMAHVSAIHPFIELPDLMLAKGEPITAITLTAMAVGPKLGVLGDAIPVEDAAAMDAALANMEVTLRDGAGTVVSTAPGSAVLGHPANSVLWLIGKGVSLQPGDLVSVGSFGPLVPAAQMNGGASASYVGLPGDPRISVNFSE
ncbi:2-keto-4-pentenoate hydratase [Sulfitobacter aestuarii]|uniref:2-keto-4-pentenoate hydratase n=1 Tax=Sulfitobacter aestuarii TaxID=2161676 RepID=A0ABW5U450_9RHOB